MRKLILIITFVFTFQGLFSQNLDDLHFGSDSTLDVVSWNLEWFPTSGQTTIDYVVDIINALDVDVIALQEINETSMFYQLVDELEGWNGYCVDSDYLELAYLYRADGLQVQEIFQIFFSNDREFPREPLVMKMKYGGQVFVIINNHLKCCGDGIMNLDNEWDEETRRFDACNLLDDYISTNLPDENVILLGDLNDLLTDEPGNNVFQTFLDDSENYLFTDMAIAEGSSSNWSYPTWPSHLDHIMITNELFNDVENPNSAIQTIKVDEYLPSGWWEYENNVSDHRPVGLKLFFEPTALPETNSNQPEVNLSNYPNPFSDYTTIVFDPSKEYTRLEIYASTGKQIMKIDFIKGQSSIIWNTKDLPEGIYMARLMQNERLMGMKKLVLSR
jgi:endonuclease/exonuclease/phosphatase family metal-dependent hydrolase